MLPRSDIVWRSDGKEPGASIFHALAFLGWLMLFSVQILLIRRGSIRLHRRLGILALLLLPAMIVLGPATAIVMDAARYGPGNTSFPFMSTQFTNVLASSVLILAGLWWRKSASAHKRLMLMGTLALTEPGLSRIYAGWLYDRLGEGFGPYLVETYSGGFVLMLGGGLYDLATRGRLHPAYVAAFAWCLANEVAAAWLYYLPWWADVTRHLVGH